VNDDQADRAETAYNQALDAINAVLNSDANDEQVEAAQKAFDKAETAYNNAVLADIAQRTVFLEALSASLAALTQSVQANPIGDTLDKLNSITQDVNELLEEAKKE
jgi:hypothetical protein